MIVCWNEQFTRQNTESKTALHHRAMQCSCINPSFLYLQGTDRHKHSKLFHSLKIRGKNKLLTNNLIIKQCLCWSEVMFLLNYTIMWYTLFCLLFLQDISGNQLRDVSPLNSLTHLLTLKAERNLLHSAKLDEVREHSSSRVILLNLWNEQYVTITSTQYTL